MPVNVPTVCDAPAYVAVTDDALTTGRDRGDVGRLCLVGQGLGVVEGELRASGSRCRCTCRPAPQPPPAPPVPPPARAAARAHRARRPAGPRHHRLRAPPNPGRSRPPRRGPRTPPRTRWTDGERVAAQRADRALDRRARAVARRDQDDHRRDADQDARTSSAASAACWQHTARGEPQASRSSSRASVPRHPRPCRRRWEGRSAAPFGDAGDACEVRRRPAGGRSVEAATRSSDMISPSRSRTHPLGVVRRPPPRG